MDHQTKARKNIEMDVFKVLHMNGGEGETSYAKNSLIQSVALSKTEHIRKEAIARMYKNCFSTKCLSIADFGCSSGPNALVLARQLVATIDKLQHELGHRQVQSPDLQVLLNDLPENDFNTVFRSLPSTTSQGLRANGGHCFFNGVPGSFYGRLFLRESLHFAHSNFSLHWLSRVPRGLGTSNKGELWLSGSSPESVQKAYLEQFRADFSTFLRCRSEEMVAGGCMVISLLGRENEGYASKRDASYSWSLLSLAIRQMVSEGLIEEEKLDSFNIPIYHSTVKEIRSEIEKEGSFLINSIDTYELGWEKSAGHNKEGYIGRLGNMRSIAEPLLVAVFGGGQLMEEIFAKYSEILRDAMSKGSFVVINHTVSLTKISPAVG